MKQGVNTKVVKMWQEFKILLLGLKRKKIVDQDTKSKRRHSSCPPGSKKNEELVINTEIADEEGLENDDDNMTSEESKSSMTEEDILADLNHAAAKHRIAIRPNNRRTPSRLGQPPGRTPSPDQILLSTPQAQKALTRSASLSSIDFVQIQEECKAVLKTKAHSVRALPTVFLVDSEEADLAPNVIMVRTLPHKFNDNNTLCVNKEDQQNQQEKFQISIANWCLANEGLRKSIQSFPSVPNPISHAFCISSESLASICSGLQALDSGVADIIEEVDKKEDKLATVTTENEDIETKKSETVLEKVVEEITNETEIRDEEAEIKSVLESLESSSLTEVIDNNEVEDDDNDDGLLNVNVKERRQYLMQVLKTKQVFQTLEQNATLSRIAAKNAAVVKMAVKNLQNNIDLDTDLTIIDTNAGGGGTGETDSLLAIEASSRVKLMVSKFDNKTVVVE